SILVPWAIPTVVSALLWKWIFQAVRRRRLISGGCRFLLVHCDHAHPIGATGLTPHVVARVRDPIPLRVPTGKIDAPQRVPLLHRSTGPAAGNLASLVPEVGHGRSSSPLVGC
ncbi:hypothetical protein, partial [Kribbella sp. NPDC051770]|uniref:hypothetical protein n=1 Tax=Kribbella sp. NPDC051770 TaxID=3155413 RepID=UPI00342FFEC9